MTVDPNGYQFDAPTVISYNEYIAQSGATIYQSWPVRAIGTTPDGIKLTGINNNKAEVIAYDSPLGVSGVYGIALRTIMASGTSTTGWAGLNERRRDYKLLQAGGPVNMYFVSGTTTHIHFCTTIAPAPSGFQVWFTGMKVLGKLWQYSAGTGSMASVMIDINNTPMADYISGVATGQASSSPL